MLSETIPAVTYIIPLVQNCSISSALAMETLQSCTKPQIYKKIMHELLWIMIFGHEWGDLPMIYRSDEVTIENHWQITSRVTKKSLFTVTLLYVLNRLFYVLNTQFHQKQPSIAHFVIVAKDGLFLLALWRHHNWSVMSCECEALELWRHIRRLFLHAWIGAKGIFTSE